MDFGETLKNYFTLLLGGNIHPRTQDEKDARDFENKYLSAGYNDKNNNSIEAIFNNKPIAMPTSTTISEIPITDNMLDFYDNNINPTNIHYYDNNVPTNSNQTIGTNKFWVPQELQRKMRLHYYDENVPKDPNKNSLYFNPIADIFSETPLANNNITSIIKAIDEPWITDKAISPEFEKKAYKTIFSDLPKLYQDISSISKKIPPNPYFRIMTPFMLGADNTSNSLNPPKTKSLDYLNFKGNDQTSKPTEVFEKIGNNWLSNIGDYVAKAKQIIEAKKEEAKKEEAAPMPKVDSGPSYPVFGGGSRANQIIAQKLNAAAVLDRLKRNKWNDQYGNITPGELQAKTIVANMLGLPGPAIPEKPPSEADVIRSEAPALYQSARADEAQEMQRDKSKLEAMAKTAAAQYQNQAKMFIAAQTAQAKNDYLKHLSTKEMMDYQGKMTQAMTNLIGVNTRALLDSQEKLLAQFAINPKSLSEIQIKFTKLPPTAISMMAYKASAEQMKNMFPGNQKQENENIENNEVNQ